MADNLVIQQLSNSLRRVNVDHPDGVFSRRSDEVIRQIAFMIFDGRLLPGDRLPSERQLAIALKVSRTTLRDAINRLEARGYLERRPKSGSYVCTSMPRSFRSPIEEGVESHIVSLGAIIEIRKVLEAWAAEKAAAAADRSSLEKLRGALRVMKATIRLKNDVQFKRHGEADLRFHQTIAATTGNPVYVHLMAFLTRLIGQSISISRRLLSNEYGTINVAMHAALFEAIRGGDAAAARQAMLDHFAFVEKCLSPAGRRRRPAGRNPRRRRSAQG